MAVGKTSVGRRAAELAGLSFVDLDDLITARAGCTIAEIFKGRGEAHFRALEAEALDAVIAGAPAIVATGGGAPCHGDNLERMRACGLVIALSAPIATLSERVAGTRTRPLFARPESEVRALYESRASMYRQAQACVLTDGATVATTIDGAARQVLTIAERAWALPEALVSETSLVALADCTYPIVVAPGALDLAGAIARQTLPDSCRTVALVSDDNVAPLYADRLADSLAEADFSVTRAVVPAGERSKSFTHFSALCTQLAPVLDRRSAIVALGGGVVGDLAGLVAATLFRGIACVQVPTTLLAMTDSAIGGKTGINLSHGKNLVGAFWQPRAVIADPQVLATLPGRELRAAFGELLKYGLLAGERSLTAMEYLAPHIADGTAAGDPVLVQLSATIARCAAYKGWVVTRDAREQTGERALLNLGHTVGHAIEAAGEYRALLHGEAVALGLIAACRISARLGLCDPALEGRVAAILARAGLGTDLAPWLQKDVLARIAADKKRAGRNINFIAVHAPGDCRIVSLEIEKIARKLLADLCV